MDGVKEACRYSVGLARNRSIDELLSASSCPKNNSSRIGPSQPRTLGSLNGVTRLTLNMLSGAALSLKISGPPSPGPHHRL